MADSKPLVSKYDGTHVKVGKTFVRIDAGSVVPDGADEEHVKLLRERGMVAEGEPAAGFTIPSGPVPFDVEEDAKASSPASRKSAPAGS